MDEKELLRTTGFVSSGFGGRRRFKAAAGSKKQKKRVGQGAAFLLVRLGVCALAFTGVLGLKLSGRDEAIQVINELTGGENSGGSTDSTLGKLKFVELPSIIEVFAPSDSAILPVTALDLKILPDDGGLAIVTAYGSDVVSPVDGRVKSVSEDPEFGKYVSVTADGDVEFAVYGLGEISVEQGQPVKQRQKLGSALGASVVVRAWKSGRPVDISEIFGLGGAS